MIEFMAEKHNITQAELKLLTREFRRKEILLKSKDHNFKVNLALLFILIY